jgi:hypothetical protein
MEYKYTYVNGGGKKKFNISLVIAVISFLISIVRRLPEAPSPASRAGLFHVSASRASSHAST